MKPLSPLLPSTRFPLARGALVTLVLFAAPLLRGMAGAAVPAATAPRITRQPASVSLYAGQTLTLTVTAEAYPAPTFQWRRNGVNLQGGTATQFSLPGAQAADAGTYEVVVSNRVGRVTSQPATVTLVPSTLPTVTREPVSATVTLGATVSFSVVVAGTPAPTYQWRKDGAILRGATGPILTVYQVQPSDEGAYDVLVSNPRGTVLSRAASLHVNVPAPTHLPPRIDTAPASVALRAGDRTVLTVKAAGEALAFQWCRNGIPLPGANAPTLGLGPARESDMGFYSVVITGAGGRTESEAAIVTVATPGNSSGLANLSTRGFVPRGDALTVGFSWRAEGMMPVLVRGVGPALSRFGMGELLEDPNLELLTPEARTATWANNDWGSAATSPEVARATAASGAFPLADDSRDAAAVVSLPGDSSRTRTVRVTSVDSAASGLVLAEVYALSTSPTNARITSLSTLGWTGAGDRVLVAAFVIAGPAPKRLLIRVVGPGLASFGVTETVANPRFALWATGLGAPVVQADDWDGNEAVAAAARTVGAFPLSPGSRDAAGVTLLPPGAYTVVAEAGDGLGGFVLVEVYDLDS